jgi:hypothetical protein
MAHLMLKLCLVTSTFLYLFVSAQEDIPTSPDCEILPVTVTGFRWHNSTHNCGCDDGGCLPTGVSGGPGCGPPDTAQATFWDPNNRYNGTCYRGDPGTVPAGIIPGAGAYSCLSLGTRWAFGTKGWILFTDPNVVW